MFCPIAASSRRRATWGRAHWPRPGLPPTRVEGILGAVLSDRLEHLLASYRRWTGATLAPDPDALFESPFAVLAHGTEEPPILWYGNRVALTLWEMTWEELTSMPSLRTAEPDQREARARLLAEVARRGYSSGYTGVRVSRTGRRFQISDAVVWNVLGPNEQRLGQAAMFRTWRHLPATSAR
jgi:hypothetical protein